MRILVAALFAASSTAVHAAHPLITEDAATQGAGNFQLELNGELSTDREAGVRTRMREQAAVLTAGVTDSVDVLLGVPRLRIATRSPDASEASAGPGDVSVDVKWQFYARNGTAFAVKPGITVPAGDEARGLGTGRSTYGVFVVGSFEADPWALHVHTGYRANRNRLGQPVDVVHLSAATVYRATGRMRLAVDVGFDTDLGLSLRQRPGWLLLGAIYSLSDRLELDLGVKRGINSAATDLSILLGMTARW